VAQGVDPEFKLSTAKKERKKERGCQVLVAHACNPNYLGDRDHENHNSRPAQVNSSPDPMSKILNTKKGWQSGSSSKSVCLTSMRLVSSNPSTSKKQYGEGA
jgi:hypothetical protein